MSTEIEMRHFERQLLFDLYEAKAGETGSLDRLIKKIETRMEQDDVKVVRQIWNGEM